MGIKKLFKTKPDPEPTVEQNREELMDLGVAVKSEKQRKDKFAAFRDYARGKNENRPELAPRILGLGKSHNPYSRMDHGGAHSYEDLNGPSRPSPYASSTFTHSDSNLLRRDHGSAYQNGYQNQGQMPPTDGYSGRNDGYSGRNDPYQYQSQLLLDNATIQTDLNRTPQYDNQSAYNQSAYSQPAYNQSAQYDQPGYNQMSLYDEEDLNAVPYQDETSLTAEDLEQLRIQQEEEEEVDRIKQDIKFTKQQSVASTRNTLRMAEEAYASGQNTLGMLGSQSERLYGVQRNMALAEVQSKLAEDKTKEMVKLNRSIFAVHASNPFNSKRKLRMQEEKIKQNRLNERLLHDQQRNELHQSERRVIDGLQEPAKHQTDLYNKYNDQKILDNAKRYQFENDEDDDDMEREIHLNLNLIGNHASNLRKMAMTIGKETEVQNKRMDEISEDADRLDINIHLNNHRLNGIR